MLTLRRHRRRRFRLELRPAAPTPRAAAMLPLAAARRRYRQKQPPREADEVALARGIGAALRAELAAADGVSFLWT